MPNTPNSMCFCSYARFVTPSRTVGAALMGANHLVGDVYTLHFELQENHDYRVWLENKFGEKVAFLEQCEVERVLRLNAKGWNLRAVLCFVALAKEPDSYWGEVALVGNDPHYNKQFNAFVENLQVLIAQGIRPALNLGEEAAKRVVATNGTWIPTDRDPYPTLDANSVIVKKSKGVSEKLVEAGRNSNAGCWVVTVVFWLLIAGVIVAALSKLLGVW